MANDKIKVHFVSIECYPAAKVGGLADVVGSLPKYLNKEGCEVSVFMPRFHMKWFKDKKFEYQHIAQFYLHEDLIHYGIAEVVNADLGFRLFVVDIPGKFDRNGVYSDENGNFFTDEVQRHICFQRAYINYIVNEEFKPDVVHCHDHHTGLIPFMIRNCEGYQYIANLPIVFTIHNERYQGVFPWSKHYYLPQFNGDRKGLLDWANLINPLASAVKCSWKVTTVSPSYMEELHRDSMGLEPLFNQEWKKCVGILNGIDTDVWNPTTDTFITDRLEDSIDTFKANNKIHLLKQTNLDPSQPLVSFIGRFAGEKGADLIPEVIRESLRRQLPINFVILGTGDKHVEHEIGTLSYYVPDKVASFITYSEAVSHQIYAGSDFILMPSRVEPCGLNQMYAMRYGTIPIVHNIGGLKDSVTYFDGENGTGLKFNNLDIHTIVNELEKAIYLFNRQEMMQQARSNAMEADFSWEKSAKKYKQLYKDMVRK